MVQSSVVTGMSTNHLPTHLLVTDPAVLSIIFDKLRKTPLHSMTSPLTDFSTKRKNGYLALFAQFFFFYSEVTVFLYLKYGMMPGITFIYD